MHIVWFVCYIARLSLNKMSTVIGWFLVTCPWSNSNASWLGCNCAVVARTRSLFVYFCFLLRKLISFVFPQILMFPSISSRETSGLLGKQNCFPRDHKLSVYCLITIHVFVHRCRCYHQWWRSIKVSWASMMFHFWRLLTSKLCCSFFLIAIDIIHFELWDSENILIVDVMQCNYSFQTLNMY